MIQLSEVTSAVGQLDEEKLLQLLNDFVASNPTEGDAQAVVNACQQGMAIVGEQFESGEYFVGDLIFAGELLSQSIESLKPIIGSASASKVGKIVLGTVEGDLHDIGKNIFRSMAEAAGFEVFDLGIDQKPSTFVEKVEEVKPDVIGMSGVLTLALEAMKKTVEELKNAGLRDNVKIIIGGNPVTAEACKQIGADAFTTNAAEGVKICQEWLK
ncbi:cobalamin-dependent protein [Dehalobacter sp. DCM]|uniref:cobalamin B12-binding domain-containing protein n=1 Tax=Dehalobacter sp. DCM TaxID=2907827 RepID=UPI003082140F|nr:cobalamin-dependent protein [Dehalobacter sp. DCM]